MPNLGNLLAMAGSVAISLRATTRKLTEQKEPNVWTARLLVPVSQLQPAERSGSFSGPQSSALPMHGQSAGLEMSHVGKMEEFPPLIQTHSALQLSRHSSAALKLQMVF